MYVGDEIVLQLLKGDNSSEIEHFAYLFLQKHYLILIGFFRIARFVFFISEKICVLVHIQMRK